MEKQLKSDIEVEVIFKGVSPERLPDFEFSFYTELHQSEIFTCSKEGGQFVNCVIEESEDTTTTVVRCILENHDLKSGRLCVLAHIKWVDADYTDGVRNDIYRQKLNLIVKP